MKLEKNSLIHLLTDFNIDINNEMILSLISEYYMENNKNVVYDDKVSSIEDILQLLNKLNIDTNDTNNRKIINSYLDKILITIERQRLIEEILNELEIDSSKKCYEPFITAVLYSLEIYDTKPNTQIYITKDIYPYVAKKYNIPEGSIDRLINITVNFIKNSVKGPEVFTKRNIFITQDTTNFQMIMIFAQYIRNIEQLQKSDNRNAILIDKLLTSLGADFNYNGYLQLKEAVLYVLKIMSVNPITEISITKDIYPEVAKKFAVSPASVERNIRSLITNISNNKVTSDFKTSLFCDGKRNSLIIMKLVQQIKNIEYQQNGQEFFYDSAKRKIDVTKYRLSLIDQIADEFKIYDKHHHFYNNFKSTILYVLEKLENNPYEIIKFNSGKFSGGLQKYNISDKIDNLGANYSVEFVYYFVFNILQLEKELGYNPNYNPIIDEMLNNFNREKLVSDIMNLFLIPNNPIFKEAVLTALEFNQKISFSKQLYPLLAKKYNTDVFSIMVILKEVIEQTKLNNLHAKSLIPLENIYGSGEQALANKNFILAVAKYVNNIDHQYNRKNGILAKKRISKKTN